MKKLLIYLTLSAIIALGLSFGSFFFLEKHMKAIFPQLMSSLSVDTYSYKGSKFKIGLASSGFVFLNFKAAISEKIPGALESDDKIQGSLLTITSKEFTVSFKLIDLITKKSKISQLEINHGFILFNKNKNSSSIITKLKEISKFQGIPGLKIHNSEMNIFENGTSINRLDNLTCDLVLLSSKIDTQFKFDKNGRTYFGNFESSGSFAPDSDFKISTNISGSNSSVVLELKASTDKKGNFTKFLGNFSSKITDWADPFNFLTSGPAIASHKSNSQISGEIGFDSKKNLVTFNKINVQSKGADIKVLATYDLKSTIFNIGFRAPTVDLSESIDFAFKKQRSVFEIFKKLQSFTHPSNLDFLSGINYNVSFEVDKLIVGDELITKLKGGFSNINNQFAIKTSTFYIDDKYPVEISSRSIGSKFESSFIASLDPSNPTIKKRGDAASLYMKIYSKFGQLEIAELFFKSKESDAKLEGRLDFRSNQNSNVIDANLRLENLSIGIDESSDAIKQKLFPNEFGVLQNFLIFANSAKINGNINLDLANLTFIGKKINNLKLDIKIDPERIYLGNGKVEMAEGNFNFEALLFFKDLRPFIRSEISSNSIDLSAINEKFDSESENNDGFLVPKSEYQIMKNKIAWKRQELNSSFLKGLDLDMLFNMSRIKFGNFMIDSFKGSIKSDKDILNIKDVEIKIKGAQARILANIDLNNDLYSTAFSLGGLELQQSATNAGLIAYLNANGKFSTYGKNLVDIISNVFGEIKYKLFQYNVQGIDMDVFLKNLSSVRSNADLIYLGERSIVSGNTLLKELEGKVNLRSGTGKSSFSFSAERFNGGGSLNFSILSFLLKGIVRLSFIPENYDNKIVNLDLNLGGNFYNQNKSFDVEKLRKNLKIP